ncbi:thermonuclease family protein [candidate division KSB1 bacterium]|nr:thermonuclease family protein [candidate division KSB1 bacterium]
MSSLTGKKWALLLIFLSVALFSQETVKVDEALDSHRFRLKDGRIVQLVNVDAPLLADTSRGSRSVTREIKKYLKSEITHYPHVMESTSEQVDDSVTLVHLFRKYTLNEININLEYLKRGYGFYRTEPKSDYSEAYFEAAQKAYRNKDGIWNSRFLGRRKPNPMAKRFRSMGGFFTRFDEYEDVRKSGPLLGFSYRISKLIQFVGDRHNCISIAAEYVNYYILLSHIHIGPEVRLKRYFSFSGSYGAFLIPLFCDANDFVPFEPAWQVNFGILMPKRYAELEFSLIYIGDHSPWIRCALCFANPYI